MKPKILYLVTEDWFFCSHFLERAAAMREDGFDVVVVTRVKRHGKTIEDAGIRLHNIDLGRRSLGPWRELHTLAAIRRIYRLERPDFVHHIALKPIIYGTFMARLSGIRNIVNAPIGMGYVFTSQHVLALFLRLPVLVALRLLLNPPGSRVIFENRDDMYQLCSKKFVRPEDAVLIRGAGVDLVRFHPSQEPSEPLVVTLTSRMLWDKGIGEFVEAARLLKSSGVAARFLLVGDSDTENPAMIEREQLASWQKEGVIEWLGHRDDIPAILAMSHIVCLPSYREGLPKSLLEALAAGKPIVTTDVPGCREVVNNGENGLLVPAKNAEKLAAAIKQLLENKALRQKFSARGRGRAEEEFGSDKVIAETQKVYQEIVNRF